MKKKLIPIKIFISLLLIVISIATIYFGYTIFNKTLSAPKESELGDFPIIYLC